jgi:hypothetical protein
MKRLCVGMLITLFAGCTVGTPVAEKPDGSAGMPAVDNTKSSGSTEIPSDLEFANGIPGFCNDTCTRFADCDLAPDCLAQCTSYMSAFLSHGDACIALGVEFEACLNAISTCDEYNNPPACEQDTGPHDLCAARGSDTSSTTAPTTCLGCDPSCEVSGGGGGPVNPGGPPVATSCTLDGDNCSDGSTYQLRCSTVQGVLTCNCFKNGNVTGTFDATTGCPPSNAEMFQGCGWALPTE